VQRKRERKRTDVDEARGLVADEELLVGRRADALVLRAGWVLESVSARQEDRGAQETTHDLPALDAAVGVDGAACADALALAVVTELLLSCELSKLLLAGVCWWRLRRLVEV